VLERLPDKPTGKNTHYEMIDARLSAFSVFFTQNPSFLSYQKTMAETKGRSNAQSLFEVHQIPSDNHIRDLLDEVKPEEVFPVFAKILQELEASQQLMRFRSFAGNLLMAMNGTEYFMLKTRDYNLENNFGHGKKYLSSFLATLNIRIDSDSSTVYYLLS
jgi:hypothetical protein